MRVLTLLITILPILTSCGSKSSSALFDEKTHAEEPELMGHTEIFFPRVPRRKLVRETTWYESKSLFVGIDTNFGGQIYKAQTQIELTRKYAIVIWLFAPGDDRALVDEGSVFLNNSDQRKFVFICRYKAYLTSDSKFLGKISVFGSGVGKEDGFRDSTEVIQTSKLFDVDTGASWSSVFEQCRNYGEQMRYKESLNADLDLMVKGMVYHDSMSECITDNHCSHWHEKIEDSFEAWTKPECVSQSNKVRFCAIRSKKGGSCPLYNKNGERLTSGLFEYKCAKGLNCKTAQEGGWFKNWSLYSDWRGECH